MMETKDWVSFFVGFILAAFGFLPLLANKGIGPSWFAFNLPVSIVAFIFAAGGFYLVINSFIEITNSNAIGWASFTIAGVITFIGIMQVLGQFGRVSGWIAMTWMPAIFFNFIFLVLGLFLMVAAFAMEL